MPEEAPTRQRLLDAALRLFAARGFDGTTVGHIEAAVGLRPRRGALYKHFVSKQALLEAAVRARLDAARTVAAQIGKLEPSPMHDTDVAALGPMIDELGRWFLDEMDRLEDLTRVFERDADRLRGLVPEAHAGLVDLSYRTAVRLITAVRPQAEDPEALAVLILAPLVAVRRTEWTYGTPPLGLTDKRLLGQWTQQVLAMLDGP